MRLYITYPPIQVLVTGHYDKGTSRKRFEPGEPQDIHNMRVFIVNSNAEIEITSALNTYAKNEIKSDAIELMFNNSEGEEPNLDSSASAMVNREGA